MSSPKPSVSIVHPTQPIGSVGDFLDMMMNAETDYIVLHKKHLVEAFFDLGSGLAGECLQKVSNYRKHLAIIGDFSVYHSKALKDFIYESNKTKTVVFVSNTTEALQVWQ